MDTIAPQPHCRNSVGASPAKKQKTRSYAAVVRSSFKAASQSSSEAPMNEAITQPPSNNNNASVVVVTSQDQRVPSNGTKSKSQTLDPRRIHQHQLPPTPPPTLPEEEEQLDPHQDPHGGPAGLMPLPSELDVQSFLRKLDQALELEVKFRGAVQPSKGMTTGPDGASTGGGSTAGSITSGMRDGSAHVLRCLKVWYDLPSDVLFNAISSIDRFLAKMKAQPKHLSCIAVSAFHLACNQYRQLQAEAAEAGLEAIDEASLVPIPDPADLVSISQSRCSPSDLLRMQNILQSKLDIHVNPLQSTAESAPVTSLTFLKLMYQVVRATALRLDLFELLPQSSTGLPDHLVHQLEILACDSMTLNYRPCEVALALLATDIQARVDKDPKQTPALRFLSELQKYCNISSEVFVDCLNVVMSQLDKYNSECMVAHRQRLVWKLSNRTLRHLRPTDKLRATLPTISEAGHGTTKRVRSASECSLDPEEDSMSLNSEDGVMAGSEAMDGPEAAGAGGPEVEVECEDDEAVAGPDLYFDNEKRRMCVVEPMEVEVASISEE